MTNESADSDWDDNEYEDGPESSQDISVENRGDGRKGVDGALQGKFNIAEGSQLDEMLS